MSGTLHPWTVRISVLLAVWLLSVSVGRLCRQELRSALRPESWLLEEMQSCADKLSAQVTALGAIINPGWILAKRLIDIVVFLLELAFAVNVWGIQSFVSAVRKAFVGGAAAGRTLAVLLEPRLAQNFVSSALEIIVGVEEAARTMPLALSSISLAAATVCMVLTRALGNLRKGSTATFCCSLIIWTQTTAPQLLDLDEKICSSLQATMRVAEAAISESSLEEAAKWLDSPKTAYCAVSLCATYWVLCAVVASTFHILRRAQLVALELCRLGADALSSVFSGPREEDDELADGIAPLLAQETPSAQSCDYCSSAGSRRHHLNFAVAEVADKENEGRVCWSMPPASKLGRVLEVETSRRPLKTSEPEHQPHSVLVPMRRASCRASTALSAL